MKNIRFSLKSIPFLLFGLTLLTYGLLIPWLGFYWDDWNFAWISHFLGPQEFIPAFAAFRPFLGPIFVLTATIFKESPIAWQLFGLLIRFAITCSAWWALKQIWPQHPFQTLIVSLLILVFPGYGQQWVAFTHTNQEFIPLTAYILSFGFTALAMRVMLRRTLFLILALLLGLIGLFSTEYFIGFEFLRILIIWYIIEAPGFTSHFKTTIKVWFPFLILWILDAVWLYFYYRSSLYTSYGTSGTSILGSSPSQFGIALLNYFIQAIATAGFGAWTQTFNMFVQPFQSLSFWLTFSLGVFGFVITLFYLLHIDLPDRDTPAESWAKQAILLGLVGILAGRIPSWVAGLPISLDFSWDRFMISMLFGSALLLAGLIEFFIQADKRKIVVLSLLIAISISHQFTQANSFRRDWEQQKNFFWQLSWRAPSIQPGTILLTHETPIQYESDLSLSAPLNWIYSPSVSKQLSYVLLYTKIRLGYEALPAISKNQPVSVPYRTTRFTGNTSNVVVFYLPSDGCLRVFDPIYDNKNVLAYLPYQLTDAINLSDPNRLIQDKTPVTPSEGLFGKEPERNWCYYYEKAELARQTGDWENVIKLGDKALSDGYTSSDSFEWLPFIEGYARLGKLDQATKLSLRVLKSNPDVRTGVCQVWQRAARENLSQTSSYEGLLSQFSCP